MLLRHRATKDMSTQKGIVLMCVLAGNSRNVNNTLQTRASKIENVGAHSRLFGVVGSQCDTLSGRAEDHTYYGYIHSFFFWRYNRKQQINRILCYRPVSYTHLDVYKRQVLLCGCLIVLLNKSVLVTVIYGYYCIVHAHCELLFVILFSKS